MAEHITKATDHVLAERPVHLLERELNLRGGDLELLGAFLGQLCSGLLAELLLGIPGHAAEIVHHLQDLVLLVQMRKRALGASLIQLAHDVLDSKSPIDLVVLVEPERVRKAGSEM